MAASIDPQMSRRRQHIDGLLDLLGTQFLEMVPIRKMKWKDEETAALVATPELQLRVLHTTILNPVCRLHPPALSYRRHFMKQLIQKLELLGAEICDEVYETYTDLLTQREDEDDTLCYKTYTLPGGERVSLQESVNLVSQGTTGLSTWQAAQHLAEWVIENPNILRNKNVVELGCGLGLTGTIACRACDVQSYSFTDCHPQVLFLLAKNLETNLSHTAPKTSHCDNKQPDSRDKKMFRKIKRQLSSTMDKSAFVCAASGDVSNERDNPEPEIETVSSPDDSADVIGAGGNFEDDNEEEISVSEGVKLLKSEVGGTLEVSEAFWELEGSCRWASLRADPRISIRWLDWDQTPQHVLSSLKPDVVLGADIVYDPHIIPVLVSRLRQLLDSGGGGPSGCTAFVASTVRNEDTRDAFLIALSAEGLYYTVVEGPRQKLFHYDRMVPIEILQISCNCI